MIKTSLAVLTLAIAAVSTGAYAQQSANATTARLNQQQLQGAPITAQPYNEATAAAAEPDPNAAPDTTVSSVTVAAPPHDSTEGFGQPDTNPQSSGTPSTDTPYVAVIPAPNGQTDDDPAPQ